MVLGRARKIEAFDDFIATVFQLSYATYFKTMKLQTFQFLKYDTDRSAGDAVSLALVWCHFHIWLSDQVRNSSSVKYRIDENVLSFGVEQQ